MPELTKAQIDFNRRQQPFCGQCHHCKIDCRNTDRCIECMADFRDTGIKTGFTKRYQYQKQDGVPEYRKRNRTPSKRSAPAYMQ